MQLYNKLQELSENYKAIQKLKSTLDDTLTHNNLKSLLENSFSTLSNELKQSIINEVEAKNKQTKQALEDSYTKALNQLISDNLANIITQLKNSLNEANIQQKVTHHLIAENQQTFNKSLLSMLKRTVENIITTKKDNFKSIIDTQINNLDSSLSYLINEKVTENLFNTKFDSALKHTLHQKSDAIIQKIDFRPVIKDLKDNEKLINAAKATITESIEAEINKLFKNTNIKGILERTLKDKNKEIFLNHLDEYYNEIKHKRFLNGLNSLSLNIQNSLNIISHTLEVLRKQKDMAMDKVYYNILHAR